jgi:hypothetical protein
MSKSDHQSELGESLRQLFKLSVAPSVLFESERVFNDKDNIQNKSSRVNRQMYYMR